MRNLVQYPPEPGEGMVTKKFNGPIIDRGIFGDDLPENYSSDIPYFFVQDRKNPLTSKKFKFEWNGQGWWWNPKN